MPSTMAWVTSSIAQGEGTSSGSTTALPSAALLEAAMAGGSAPTVIAIVISRAKIRFTGVHSLFLLLK